MNGGFSGYFFRLVKKSVAASMPSLESHTSSYEVADARADNIAHSDVCTGTSDIHDFAPAFRMLRLDATSVDSFFPRQRWIVPSMI